MPQTRAGTRLQEQNNDSRDIVPTDDKPEKMDLQENIDPLAAEQHDLDLIKSNVVLSVKEPAVKKKKTGRKPGKKNKKDKTEPVIVAVDEVDAPVAEEPQESDTQAATEPAIMQDIAQSDVTTVDPANTESTSLLTPVTLESSVPISSNQDEPATEEAQTAPITESEQPDIDLTTSRGDEVKSALAALEGRSTMTTDTSASLQSDTTLLISQNIMSPRSEDAIEAIDALEDALEELGNSLPNVPLSPEKKIRKQAKIPGETAVSKTAATKAKNGAKSITQPTAPIMSTKQPIARTKVTGALLKTTQPSAVSRATTVRSGQPGRAASGQVLGNKGQATTAPKKANDVRSAAKPIDYLASKRRPVSMQFPPPPAPVKSTKALTRPTFTLPGDAISARKKALLEEKLRKEEEELQRRRSFKPRPIPESIRARPVSMIVKQNASSRARLSVLGGINELQIDRKQTVSPANTALKRSNTTTTIKTTATRATATNVKRMSLKENASKANANTSVKRDGTGSKATHPTTIAAKRNSMMPLRPSLSTSTNSPAASLTLVKPRPKSMMLSSRQRPSTGVKPSPTEALALKAKAKSIYNRDCNGGDILARERRDKEEAAKRARAAAAEKGRQASREWAEKQRKKLMDAKLAQQPKQQSSIVA